MIAHSDPRRLPTQWAHFCLVGSIGTLVHFVILALCLHFAATIPVVVASSMGWLAGFEINYCLNRRYTFASRAGYRQTLPRYLCVSLVGFALNGLLLQILVTWLQLDWRAAQAVTTATVLSWNFTASRTWAFAGG